MSTPEVYTLNVRTEPDGSLWAEVAELPGCFGSGDMKEELLDAMREAIAMYLHDTAGVPETEDTAARLRSKAERIVLRTSSSD